MRFLSLCLTFALVTMISSFAAHAQDYKTLLDIPEGATLITLSATEQMEVEQDLLIATLSIQVENANPRNVQDEINKIMRSAVDEAAKVESVKASTQQYRVNEYDRNRGKGARRDMIWRGQQNLQIKGKQADDLLELAGKLQNMGMTMNGLSYTLSPEKLEESRNVMLEAALEKLLEKARRTARVIGKSETEMLKINVDMGNNYRPQPLRHASMARSMDSAKMSAPVAAAGESMISLTVTAEALLK
jgi:predicted secreted protein